MFPPIVAAFRDIHQKTIGADSGGAGMHAMIVANDSLQVEDVTPVRLYSIEAVSYTHLTLPTIYSV